MRRQRRYAVAGLIAVTALLLPSTPAHADAVRDAQWQLGFLHAADAQAISQGDGVTVAVIDTGVDATHPDLAGNVLPGIDFVHQGGDGHTDQDGHGTDMAGLIAAHGRGDAGALGIAPKAKILPVRTGQFHENPGDPLPLGIDWAVAHGAKVICLAVAGGPGSREEESVDRAIAADVVVVAGAGNRPPATEVQYPAAYPGVLAAAAVDQAGNHADISVTGPEVGLSAPGVDLISTNKDGKYSKGTGTSDATALIAGVAALVRAKYPQLSAPEVIHRLTATAIDKGAPGRDDEYGYGIVDPVKALTADVPPLKPNAAPSSASPPTASGAAADKPSHTGLIVTITVVALVLVAGLVTTVAVLANRRRNT